MEQLRYQGKDQCLSIGIKLALVVMPLLWGRAEDGQMLAHLSSFKHSAQIKTQ